MDDRAAMDYGDVNDPFLTLPFRLRARLHSHETSILRDGRRITSVLSCPGNGMCRVFVQANGQP